MLSEALKSILAGYQSLRVIGYGDIWIWGYQAYLYIGVCLLL
jgi:hypothetical protein